MRRTITACIVQEDVWFVAQCLEVDIESQGETPEQAVTNLQEALELHFEASTATVLPQVRPFEV